MSFSARSPAGSPPAPANASLPNPRKRSSVGGTPAPSKRRKPSTYSVTSSSHPLRQTSFPPEENVSLNGLRSPSVDTDIAARSVATSMTGGKRGKKGKSAAPEGSVKSGKAGDAEQRAESEAKVDGEENGEDDEEEDGDTGLVEANFRQQAADNRRRMAILFEAGDADQQDRLSAARHFHLDNGKIRRIVNQTLSQSVPKSVILAINSYTKQFVGEIVERSIEIQRLNLTAAKGYPSPKQDDQTENATTENDEKEEPIGPLLPDSLREALRRMKRDGELGGAGLEGYSTGLGVAGARSAALGGRRLFR